MIRYCFPNIDPDSINDIHRFAELANEADWIIRNVMHPKEAQPSSVNVGKK